MKAELSPLIITAVSIAFFHTILGPDHYLPFIMMSWARKWSALKTSIITLLCGIGHIGSSVVLGLIGVAMGEYAADEIQRLVVYGGVKPQGDFAEARMPQERPGRGRCQIIIYGLGHQFRLREKVASDSIQILETHRESILALRPRAS